MVKVAVPDVVEAAPSGGADVPADAGLRRELGLFGAVSMVVGIVIGSGIFLGVNRVAAGAGDPWLIVAAWVLGGALTLAGALTYAELGVLFPRAGGEYVFLREGLGSLLAFMSGWVAFTINLAGSSAALAIVFADQLFSLVSGGCDPALLFAVGPLHITTAKVFASALILLFSILNYYGLKLGGNVQKALTVGKGALMVLLAAAALLYLGPATAPDAAATCPGKAETVSDGFSVAGFFGLAMVAVLFAYDGWTNVARMGGEIRDPRRTLPRALLIGVLAVAALYTLLSLGYLNVLGFDGFAGSRQTVATDAAHVLFGTAGQRFVAALILVSVVGSLNGITISGPRIYYAMAKDRLFPRTFAKVNRHHVPGHAIWAQAAIAIAFLLFFDFNALTDNVVFISFSMYALAAVGLMVLRRKRPDLPRPYKVPGYPVVPILFIVASFTFVGYLLYQQVSALTEPLADGDTLGDKWNRLAGLGIVLLGIPVYFLYRRRLVREARAGGLPEPEPMLGPRDL
ncbi:MAG: basic amino acid/polyamine antiporter, family [Thermoplasmata archaeon]|jgi:APA family basic amino acid/polyamine antiporter|nr:basic amino acid/polyamine antiporter, family [Thermoplasmata archaeon]MEA3166477.1 basic amino acid/polyamine antiporter, family [Thermoplasmata archaeon]